MTGHEAVLTSKTASRQGRDAVEEDPLLSEFQFVSNGTIPLNLIFLEVIEQAPTFSDKIEQSLPSRIVVGVVLEVLGESLNPFREDCDLHLRGARVVGSIAEPIYDFLFLCFGNHCAVKYLFRLCHAKEEAATPV